MSRATIADVAARAGVTKSTVSHALSGKRPVAPETRMRIEQVIAELGYQPNPVAQRLAGKGGRSVGFVYPLYSPQVAGLELRFISAAANAASEAGYAFVLLTQPESGSAGFEETVIPFLRSGLLDGVILMQIRMHDPRVEALRDLDLPFVLIGRTADNTGLSYIDLDIDAAIDMCVEHLFDLGHRRIAYLRQADLDVAFAAHASRAYETACARRKIKCLAPACGLTTEDGRTVTAGLLAHHPEITAVLSWSDRAAWGAAQAAEVAGRRVPRDFSIVCFNRPSISDLIPFELTNVDTRAEELARRGMEMLIAKLEERAVEQNQVLLEPDFVIGQTTAPVAA